MFASMIIVVNDEKAVASVQQEFHEQFPFLKVEFFLLSDNVLNGKNKKSVLPGKTFLSFAKHSHTEDITIMPGMTVSELEKQFRDFYGLGAQVFRKSGKVWLETSLTDHWTLQEQNDQGKALST